MDLTSWPAQVAAHLLSSSGRLAHVRRVSARAAEIAPLVGDDADLLIAAAWLHDIGYADDLVVTGFHPLDGARYLCKVGAPLRLTNLVARHSCAIIEARLRGLAGEIEPFPDEGGRVRDALWYCDMTASPEGKPVTLDQRLEEIQRRYGTGVVSKFTVEARPFLRGAIDRTLRRLRALDHDDQL